MDKSDRDISQWDARLKEQLERSFHNYHKRRIDLSVARDNKQFDWTGENLIVEKASSADAIATVRLMFEDADPLILQENIEIKSIFNRVFISNEVQPDEWIDVIAGINFEYKKKISGGMIYVDRDNPDIPDFDLSDFPAEDTWYDLDLSGIVPVGTKCVVLAVFIRTTAANSTLAFQTKGETNLIEGNSVENSVAGGNSRANLVIACKNTRVIQGAMSNTTFTIIDITVTGWFV